MLKNNLIYWAGQVKTRLNNPMKELSEKSKYNIRQAARQLGDDFKAAGVRTKFAKQISEQDVHKLVEYLKNKGNIIGTIEDKLSALRSICHEAGNDVPKNLKNPELGISGRNVLNPDNIDKSAVISEASLRKLEAGKRPEAAAALRLEMAYGLRREESAHVVYELTNGHSVTALERPDMLEMKGSWCKNGRQRGKTTYNGRPDGKLLLRDGGKVLRQVSEDVKGIKINYRVEQFERKINYAADKCKVWDSNPEIHPHALRHNYAHERYKELTGRDCPAAGGLTYAEMTRQEQKEYHEACQVIAEELGHDRETISRTYLGK
jgi:integrase